MQWNKYDEDNAQCFSVVIDNRTVNVNMYNITNRAPGMWKLDITVDSDQAMTFCLPFAACERAATRLLESNAVTLRKLLPHMFT